MSDIRKFSVEETATIHLRDGSDELMYADDAQKKPITVTVYGPGSKTFARVQTAQTNRAMERFKRKGKVEQSAAEKAEETAAFLASVTKDSANLEFDKLEGDALYRAVYAETSLGFIADQVNKHLGDWSNFTKNSQKS